MISAPYRWFLSTEHPPLLTWRCVSPAGEIVGSILRRPATTDKVTYFAVTKSSSRSCSDLESARLWVELIAGQACAPSS